MVPLACLTELVRDTSVAVLTWLADTTTCRAAVATQTCCKFGYPVGAGVKFLRETEGGFSPFFVNTDKSHVISHPSDTHRTHKMAPS